MGTSRAVGKGERRVAYARASRARALLAPSRAQLRGQLSPYLVAKLEVAHVNPRGGEVGEDVRSESAGRVGAVDESDRRVDLYDRHARMQRTLGYKVAQSEEGRRCVIMPHAPQRREAVEAGVRRRVAAGGWAPRVANRAARPAPHDDAARRQLGEDLRSLKCPATPR